MVRFRRCDCRLLQFLTDIEIDADPPPAGMRKAVFTLAEGDVSLTFPEWMPQDSIDDLEGYIKIWLGRLCRDASKRDDS